MRNTEGDTSISKDGKTIRANNDSWRNPTWLATVFEERYAPPEKKIKSIKMTFSFGLMGKLYKKLKERML